MRIAIVYNDPDPTAREMHWLSRSRGRAARPASFRHSSEYGVLAHASGIERALRDLGEDPRLHAAAGPAGLADFLARERPDVVFNCCESFVGDSALEMSVAALFDLFGIAYTGSPALTLGIALNKGLTKDLFRAHGVPTPPHIAAHVAADLAGAEALAFPLIVKPIAEDASIGIDDRSVVHDRAALAERVAAVCSELEQAAIVEEFIDGRELNVALLAGAGGELQMLPISEISFDALPPGPPPIVSYDAKWAAGSEADRRTPARCPAVVEAALADRVRAAALSAARAVGLRDYGRVDLRVRARDQAVFVLEVNPNPDLSADAGFMRAAAASGRTFAATVQAILQCAIARARLRGARDWARSVR